MNCLNFYIKLVKTEKKDGKEKLEKSTEIDFNRSQTMRVKRT